VIVDNLSSHKEPRAYNMIEAVGDEQPVNTQNGKGSRNVFNRNAIRKIG